MSSIVSICVRLRLREPLILGLTSSSFSCAEMSPKVDTLCKQSTRFLACACRGDHRDVESSLLSFSITTTLESMATNSPPPTAPTTSAPGERARKLHDGYARALKSALKPVNQYENFAACFPTPATYCDGALRDLHSDFVRKLGATCEAEFEALLSERDVVASLNQLDELVEEAKKRKTKAEAEGGGEVPPVP